MNASRRAELTGDQQIARLVERVRELEEELQVAIAILDRLGGHEDTVELWQAVLAKPRLEDSLAKKEEV